MSVCGVGWQIKPDLLFHRQRDTAQHSLTFVQKNNRHWSSDFAKATWQQSSVSGFIDNVTLKNPKLQSRSSLCQPLSMGQTKHLVQKELDWFDKYRLKSKQLSFDPFPLP